MGLESNDWHLYKRKEKEIWTQTYRENGYVNMEMEVGAMCLQAKEHQEARRTMWDSFSLRNSGSNPL